MEEQQLETQETEIETTETTEVEDGQQIEVTEPSAKETARESVERAAKEIDGVGSKDEGDKDEAAKTPNVAQPKQGKQKDVEFDPELSPPERLRAHEKEMFNNLPKGLRRALHRTVKDLEAVTTRTQQELVPKLKEYKDLDEILAPHLPEWASMKVGKIQGVAQLLNMHTRLKKDSPVKYEAFRWLAENSDIDLNVLAGRTEGTQQAAGDITSHPQYQALQQRVEALQNQVSPILNNYASAQSAFESEQIKAVTAEMYAVKHEKDASGKYRYPALHDDDFLTNKAKPLVTALVENAGLGYGEALRRAHDILTGTQTQAFNSTQAASLQPKPTQQRAINPAASVRGRSAAPSAGADTEIPYVKGESPRATVQRMFESLSRG